MTESQFPVEAWKEVHSTVPPYPLGLSDDVVRILADLAIHIREAGAQLSTGLDPKNLNLLVALMPLSLISGGLKRLESVVETAFTGVSPHVDP
jgi:hypothetical protein